MATLTAEPIELDLDELIAEIELTNEEILADLVYPDPPPAPR